MFFWFTLGMKLLSDYLSIIKSLIRMISHNKPICSSPIRKSHQDIKILLQMNLFDACNFLLRFWVQCLVVFELKFLLLLNMLAISSNACHILSLTSTTWNSYRFCSVYFRMFDHIRFKLHKLSRAKLLLFLLRIRQGPTLILASSTFDAW